MMTEKCCTCGQAVKVETKVLTQPERKQTIIKVLEILETKVLTQHYIPMERKQTIIKVLEILEGQKNKHTIRFERTGVNKLIDTLSDEIEDQIGEE